MEKAFTFHEGRIIPEITTPPQINKRQSLVSVVQEEKLPWLEAMCTILSFFLVARQLRAV
jgi:hypothetical protein